MIFDFRLFPGKINSKIFQKIQKTPFLSLFLADFWAKQNFIYRSILISFF